MKFPSEHDGMTDEDFESLHQASMDVCNSILDALIGTDWTCHAKIFGAFMAAVTLQVNSLKCLQPDLNERFAEDRGIGYLAGDMTRVIIDEARDWLKREAEKC